MTDRKAELIGNLADNILNGSCGKITAAYVWDKMLDESFIGNDEAELMLFGTPENVADMRDRKVREGEDIVRRWIENEPEGQALLDEEMEKEAAEVREERAA